MKLKKITHNLNAWTHSVPLILQRKYIYMCVCVCVCVCICVCMYVLMYVCIYVFMYVCISPNLGGLDPPKKKNPPLELKCQSNVITFGSSVVGTTLKIYARA